MAIPKGATIPVATPSKRKRSEDVADSSDAESRDVRLSRSNDKKVRLFRSDLDDATSDLNAPSTPSLAETYVTTLPNTETPSTDISVSTRKTKSRPKKFACHFPDCGKAFDRPIRLQTHINSHTGQRPHACSEPGCDKAFFKVEHLKQHIHDKHTDYKGFACSYKIYDEKRGGMIECGKSFTTTSKLKRHVAHHEEKEETRCVWEGCGKVFRKQETLQRHVKKEHLKDEKAYQCSEKTSDGETCGQFFATPGLLRGHKVSEHDGPRFWCDICSSAMMEDAADSPNDANSNPMPDTQELYINSEDFDDGIISISSEPLETTARKMQLSAASIGFTTYGDLQLHIKQHHPPMCPDCGQACQTTRALEAHIDIEHPSLFGSEHCKPKEEKKYLCPEPSCERAQPGNGFTRKGNLDVHLHNVHADERSFICGDFHIGSNRRLSNWNGQGCGMALKTKQSLIGHIRTQHLGVPAEVNARTGLRDEERRRRVRSRTEESSTGDIEIMDVDEATTQLGKAISMLTGVGYEDTRPYACMIAGTHGCEFRSVNEYGLVYHMEMTHGWNVDDIDEGLQSSHSSAFEREILHQLEMGLDAMQGVDQSIALDPQLQQMAV